MKNTKIFILFFLLSCIFGYSQSGFEVFLKPSDSLNKQRKNTLIISEITIATATLVGLYQLWYADYPRSKFHFINDNNEWLQMDKMGHFYAAYQLGNLGKNGLQWSGVSPKKQLIYGATLGLVFLTSVEILDGYSSQWGASAGDLLANTSGTVFYISQELLWNEQRIVTKFSFHTTNYASLRPNVLGTSLSEQILKDYNGQTYWLSVNIHSFLKKSKMPKWLNLAVGYGADGMISGNEGYVVPNLAFKSKRYRQLYVSLDADLTKIKTKSHFLKSVFYIFNTIKIPAPTIEFSNRNVKFHYLYF